VLVKKLPPPGGKEQMDTVGRKDEKKEKASNLSSEGRILMLRQGR